MDSPRLQSGKLHERSLLPRAIIKRPFADRQVPDIATKTYEQRYAIARARYAPAIATRSPAPPVFSSAYLGPADTADTAAYLVQETDLDPLDQLRAMVRRTFANIPADQVSFDATSFSRPKLHDIFVGSYYAASFDDDSSHVWPSRIAVSAVGAITPVSTAIALDSIGAVTVTISKYGGGSFTWSTSDSVATIQAAYQTAFSSVFSAPSVVKADNKVYIYSGYNGPSYTIGVSAAGVDITFNSPGFELTVAKASQTQTPGAPTNVRTITTGAAHGGSAGQWMAAWNGDKLVGVIKPTVASGSSITIPADESPWSIGNLVITHVAFAYAALRLVNGAKDCTIRTTEKFYLPAVTTGIATGADVPSVPLYTDPIAWLGRIVATTHTGVSATASTDKLTKTAHGMVTGDCFFVLVLGGATGIATLTQYFAIKIDADNWKAAATSALAIAGTAIDITVDGSAMTILVPAPYAAVAVSKLASWMGPILTKSYDEVQLADALEVRSPSA